jgi:hypothetical protein
MSVTIICGNGGDYEYVRDAFYWEMWIKKNMGPISFRITPHKEADKGIVTFEDDSFDIIFRLKVPPTYIDYYRDIEQK